MKNSREAEEQLSKTKTLPETHPDLLSRLPIELLREIMLYVIDEPSRNKIIRNQRIKIHQGHLLLFGKNSRLWIYEHKPEYPIMSDLQAFSVVNRKIYSVCQPIIWKTLSFPSISSAPMSFWISEILPKHGSHVQVLDVSLRYEWLKKPEKSISIVQAIKNKTSHHYSLRSSDIKQIKFIKEDKDYWEVDRVHSDNLAVFNDRGKRGFQSDRSIRTVFGLCPENLIKVLSYCENLTTLRLGSPHCGCSTAQGPDDLSCNLTALFSGLQHLQCLKIYSTDLPIFAERLLEPLRHLPDLESLELVAIAGLEEDGSLLNCISTLKHLKRLALWNVEFYYSPAICPRGPPRLANLKIGRCNKLSPSNTHSFVNSWAPCLTHLEVHFGHDTSKAVDINSFCLLNLTHLTIWPYLHLRSLDCFSMCQNISHLTFTFFPLDQTYLFANSIISHLFPKLKAVALRCQDDLTYLTEPMSHHQLHPLEVFCKSEGIDFHISLVRCIGDYELYDTTLMTRQDHW